MKFGDNQWANLLCGRSRTRIAGMSRESFPELPQMPEVLAEIPVATAGSMIAEDDLRDLGGGVAVHAERRAAVVEDRWPDDGATDGHRLAMVEIGRDLAGARSSLSGRCCPARRCRRF